MKELNYKDRECDYEGKMFQCLHNVGIGNNMFIKGERYLLEEADNYAVEHVLRDRDGKRLLYEYAEYPHIYKSFWKDFVLCDEEFYVESKEK